MKNCRFLICLCLLSLCSCNPKSTEDPRVAVLQKDVEKIMEQNEQLRTDLREIKESLRVMQAQTAPSKPEVQAPPQAPMTSERMKREVAPLLESAIRKIKVSSETPRKGNQFGMRMEFDLNHAVYGLAQSKDRRSQYTARVVVPFQKFLESEKESKSYGSGTQEFHFAYRNQRWVLESDQ